MANLFTELSLAKRKAQRVSAVDIVRITDALVEKFGDQFATRFICRALSLDEDTATASSKLNPTEVKLLFEVSENWRRLSCAATHRLFHPDDIPTSRSAGLMDAGPKTFTSEDERKLVQYEDDIKRLKARIADVEDERQVEKDRADTAEKNAAALMEECQEAKQQIEASEAMIAHLTDENEKAKEQIGKIIAKYKDVVVEGAKKEKLIRAYVKFISEEDLKILSEIAGTNVSDVDKRVFCYFKALMLTDVEDARIQTRFDRFDTELYEAFVDDKDGLAKRRNVYSELINARFIDREISWNLSGRQWDDDLFTSNDNTGTEIKQVISALVTSKTNGKCLRRAKVRTAED